MILMRYDGVNEISQGTWNQSEYQAETPGQTVDSD